MSLRNSPTPGLANPLRWAKLLVCKPNPQAVRHTRPSGLSGSHNLSGGPDLTPDVILYVAVSQPYYAAPPVYYWPMMSEIPSAPRYYWRTQTYDRYTGFGWNSRSSQRSQLCRGYRHLSRSARPPTNHPPKGYPGTGFGWRAVGHRAIAKRQPPLRSRLARIPGTFTQADLFRGTHFRWGI